MQFVHYRELAEDLARNDHIVIDFGNDGELVFSLNGSKLVMPMRLTDAHTVEAMAAIFEEYTAILNKKFKDAVMQFLKANKHNLN